MKKIILMIVSIFLLISMINFISANVQEWEGFYTNLILKQGAEIDMNTLEGYCSPNFCEIQDTPQVKMITFKINYQDKNMILTAYEYKNPKFFAVGIVDKSKNPDISKFRSDVLLGLRLLISNEIISGLPEEDVNLISEKIGTGKIVYFKPVSCGDSYFKGFDQTGDLGKTGWLASEGIQCGLTLDAYKDSCPKINCCGDYVRGELIVSFKNTTTQESAKVLIESLGLNISSVDVAGWQIGLGMFVVKVPEGEEGQWKTTLEGKEIIKSIELDGTACLADSGVPSFSDKILGLMPLPLKMSGEKSSSMIYLIMGIIIVLIIIAGFLFFKRKKE